ncbi:hypothetical protein OHV05_24640 [Kitasatospora sp. NBC_00070]|uniref:hypothetical protein n=1 Tax=Kitasatospora sp. NBC_00070 TaxID=2975962 RepID=UPI003251BF90
MSAAAPPLVGSETWLPVMEAAHYRCWCKGACGARHTVSHGHCDHIDGQHLAKYGPSRLIAAPADLSEQRFPGAALRSTALVAWCPPCYDGARRKAAREAKAESAALDVPLFDLDATA